MTPEKYPLVNVKLDTPKNHLTNTHQDQKNIVDKVDENTNNKSI